MIAGRREVKLRETAASLEAAARARAGIKEGGVTKVLAVQTDVTVSEEVERLFGEIRRVFGRAPDVVLACAGWVAPAAKMGEDPVENWWKIYVCVSFPCGCALFSTVVVAAEGRLTCTLGSERQGRVCDDSPFHSQSRRPGSTAGNCHCGELGDQRHGRSWGIGILEFEVCGTETR